MGQSLCVLVERVGFRGFAEAARASITAVQADTGETWEWAAAQRARAKNIDDGAFA
jgi:hypothetical protein